MRSNPVKITQASRKLLDKVGQVNLGSEDTNQKIQKIALEIKTHGQNFKGTGLEFLNELEQNLNILVDEMKSQTQDFYVRDSQKIVGSVMNLKANASMFGYPEITAIAAPVLDILDETECWNKDLIALTHHLCQVIKLIFSSQVNQNDGALKTLVTEMNHACDRYRQKHL
jgi:hypothetical protein